MSDLDEWIKSVATKKSLPEAIVWEDSDGTLLPWSNWSTKLRNQLNEVFTAYRQWCFLFFEWYEEFKDTSFTQQPVGLLPPDVLIDHDPNPVSDPPKNLQKPANDEHWMTVVSPKNALNLYLRYVALSLAVEGSFQLPWSILSYDADALGDLFDSRRMFQRVTSGGKLVDGYQVLYDAVPAPPTLCAAFMGLNGFIASTPKGTINRLIDWTGRYFSHSEDTTTATGWKHWCYNGAPPVSRMIRNFTPNTEGTGSHPFHEVHWTGGCHCTTGFYKSVLQSMNLPVRYVKKQGHATPFFPTVNSYLSHGDDPYFFYWRGLRPSFPRGKLLVSAATYDAWWSEKAPDAVERQDLLLAVQYLSDDLLSAFCDDKKTGASHASSAVFKKLTETSAGKKYFTVADLEAQNLWGRLQCKADDCALPVEASLVEPGDNAVLNTTTPTMKWTYNGTILNYDFMIEISPDPNFGGPVAPGNALDPIRIIFDEVPGTTTSFTVPAGRLKKGETYFWRVWAQNFRSAKHSAAFSFSVSS